MNIDLRPRSVAVLVERRVTLLGDAAHPMYRWDPTAHRRRHIDARALADALARAEHPRQALLAYEQKRLPMTAEIVRSIPARRSEADRRVDNWRPTDMTTCETC